jgi:hypothetical protein
VLLATNSERREPNNRWVKLFGIFRARLQQFKDVTVLVVEGSHHLHLDQAEDIYRPLIDFLVDPASLPNRGSIPEIGTTATPRAKL